MRSSILVGTLTALVLVLTADQQIYDTNFYSLWEATALLAGDHPYRDFFEWGVPLQAYVSAAAQLVVGYRLIGEFFVHWIFIVAGAVISFGLGLRLSRSVVASLVTMSLPLILLTVTPTFHYPKLFFYPLAVWLAWSYMERPTVSRAAVFGAVTALGFLYRHDHGVYLGGIAVLAFVATRLAVPASRQLRSSLIHAATHGAVAAVLVAPWAVVVHANEGLPEYVESRAELYRFWSARESPYQVLQRLNPVAALAPEPLPPPQRGVVAFEWVSSVDEAERQRLEKRFELRFLEGPDERGRLHYELPNLYDARLMELGPSLNDTSGFEWKRLEEFAWRIPGRDNAQLWLEQVSLLVPLLLLLSVALAGGRHWHRGEPIPLELYQIAVAATFLAVIDSRLFREASYVVVVAPLTAALSTRLLVRNAGAGAIWNHACRAIALTLLVVTAATTVSYTRDSRLFSPRSLANAVKGGFSQLLASPPLAGTNTLSYVRDCTRDGDRVIVTGSTPYHIGYLIERPIAGGHLFWHHGWRVDSVRELQSLALLKSQSVPFAFSTHDPVLADFQRYPRIREYLVNNYVELEGSDGRVLVDKRRRPTGTFGALGFPCFR